MQVNNYSIIFMCLTFIAIHSLPLSRTRTAAINTATDRVVLTLAFLFATPPICPNLKYLFIGLDRVTCNGGNMVVQYLTFLVVTRWPRRLNAMWIHLV
jgi:hypothetical protein